MRNGWTSARTAAAVVLASSLFAVALHGQQATPNAKAPAGSGQSFDPHDLSGFWDLTNMGRPAGALNAISNKRPAMTPWGLERFQNTKTGFDNALSNGASRNEKEWNDPIRWCDPTGFPRILWSPRPAGMRIAQTDDEVIQFFATDRAWREIWTDGRKLPGEDADSRWYGYAVGHWDGDTFVVNSNLYNEATWLDEYGSPHSEQMTVEERYHRVDHDHLEMTMSITDPTAYTGTWQGDRNVFQLVKSPARSEYNDLPEDICVWSETKRPIVQ